MVGVLFAVVGMAILADLMIDLGIYAFRKLKAQFKIKK